MSLLQVFRNEVVEENDISAQIYECSEISYGIRQDWGMELPEIEITTDIDDIEIGEAIYIVRSTDASKQIMFHAKEKRYDYARDLYIYRCPHAFAKLANWKAYEVPLPLMDIPFGDGWVEEDSDPALTPDYTVYNAQYGALQGQFVWERRYIQALFLLKMLIRRATGVLVADIDDGTLAAKDSFYATTNSGGVDTVWKYGDLALSTESVRRMGMSRYDDYESTDYTVQDGLPTALDLLNAVVMMLGVQIDIFRDDYLISELGVTAAPTDAATLGRSDETLELIRRATVTASGLDATDDYVYGEYDELMLFVPYVWGTSDGDDLELTDRTAQEEADGVDTSKQVSISIPRFLRLYYIDINESSGYQSRIYRILNAQTSTDELTDWLEWYLAWWDGKDEKISYQVAMTDLVMKLPRMSIDVAGLKLKYERWI